MYDIIIIGSGPSGSIFSRLIDTNKYKVLLISANDIKEKPCGGLLSPDAGKCLGRLKLTMPKDILVDPQIFSVNVKDFDNKITKNYQRCYINFNRKKFDDWLLSLINKKVELKKGIVTKIEKETNYKITIKKEGKEKIYTSTYLIGADGASGLTRSFLYPNSKTETMLSIQQWYKNSKDSPIYSCIFDSSVSKTYSWTISKDGYLIYGGAYNKREDFERGAKKITNMPPVKKEACLITNIKHINDIKTGKENCFLLGEAGGFISPSSYEGISYAMNTAIILANIFNKNNKNFNKVYNKKTKKLKIKLLTKITKAKILQNKFLRKIVMKSNISVIKVIENEENNKCN